MFDVVVIGAGIMGAAVLKDYSYLPYSKEELEDNVKMERYRELSTFARKEERSKFYYLIKKMMFLVVQQKQILQ